MAAAVTTEPSKHKDAPTQPQNQQRQHDTSTSLRMAPPHTRRGNGVSPKSPHSADPDFPRSASYTYLPKQPDHATKSVPSSCAQEGEVSTAESSGYTTPEEGILLDTRRDIAAELQKSPKLNVDDTSSASSIRTTSTVATTPPSQLSNTSLTRPTKRHSWIGSTPSTPGGSRSPSPRKFDPRTDAANDGSTPSGGLTSRRRSFLTRRHTSKGSGKRDDHHGVDNANADPTDVPKRRGSFLKVKSKPVSGLFRTASKNDPERRGSRSTDLRRMPSLPKSFSTDRLPLSRSDTGARATPVPKIFLDDRQPLGPLAPKKKDELWAVFRSLDADFTKFASKPSAFKANVVRTGLLPFLRNYAAHPSNEATRPEDLDRRTNILNKWWTGLIELLHGRNNQSISGTDRPLILDGMSGIMDRPEWRLPPSPLSARKDRLKGFVPHNKSQNSVSSDASQFLADSVHHNVRNLFVQNLCAQMAFVVDKMSFRHASASLVTFCGKACAYAFMFVPGMADILVRLWSPSIDMVRRVLCENGVGKFDHVDDGSDIALDFPPALQPLGFASLITYMRKLRDHPPPPLGTVNVDWWGQWTERWSGRESDLFYVFSKHFHVLCAEFMPEEHSKRDRLFVPGLLLVQAQLLSNLDATIHRRSQSRESGNSLASITFDDVLGDPDALASTMPLSPTNAKRIMAENRVIMLVRDFLSEKSARHPVARRMFAEGFHSVPHAAVKGVSMFDHAACYTILDFLEEALPLLSRYEQIQDGGSGVIDTTFWLTVCKKMLASQNTMTQIRLYAFLYTIWNPMASEPDRRQSLCVDLLLDVDVFESQFNHWCPMVRAYYMRILCWRIGRHDGHAIETDRIIFETLLERLRSTWSFYLFLKQDAERNQKMPPATNPCSPAPSRRLLIVRTDTQISGGASFLSFDGILPPSATIQKRGTTLSSVVELDSRPTSSRSTSDSESFEVDDNGLGGFLRKMLTSKRKPPARDATPDQRAVEDAIERVKTDSHRAQHGRQSPGPYRNPATSSPAYQSCSFKFSLEYHPTGKPMLGQMKLQPPKLPLPAQEYLLANSSELFMNRQIDGVEPKGSSRGRARYCGRSLAEWTVVVGECHNFFERRKKEGAPSNRNVETPALGVETFKRPG